MCVCVCSLLFISFCFLTVNRRLDEWVKLEQLDLDSVETVVDEKVEDKVMSMWYFSNTFIICFSHRIYFFFLILITRIVHEFFQVTSLKMTRHQKRKIDETHVEVNTSKKYFPIFFAPSYLYSSLYWNPV